ncbi:hypothetical protein [Pontibacter fetidus]|uniref:Uncharacterized protein n=1 Tax=Pontibacter fetidus TaxID=2700082 RepID=A0A6B2H2E3_9BACT|nr:hypothetical protein [Pontibacter fetidus]NDK54786.1 hypothetical protein [Pontibacter fetidus]
MKINRLLLIIVLLTFSTIVKAQSVSETLKYINEKLNQTTDVMQQGQKFKWIVSSDGKLTRTLYHRNGSVVYTNTIYLKELCVKPECIREDTMDPISQGDKPKIVYTFATPNSSNAKPFRIFMDDNADSYKVKNAVIHLVKLAQNNKSYKQKDPFDY